MEREKDGVLVILLFPKNLLHNYSTEDIMISGGIFLIAVFISLFFVSHNPWLI